MRLFSFLAFSNDIHFHSTPSLITTIFIPRLLLRHLFSFPAFSYDAGYTGRTLPPPPSLLLWAGRPRPLASRSRTLPVKSAVWGMKDVRGERPPFQPLQGGGGEDSNPYLSKHQKLLDHRRGGTKYLRLRLFSFPVFS